MRTASAATSIHDIARAADFSRTSIYQYFESKEEIYLVLLERYTDRLTERVAAAAGAVDGVPGKIRAFVEEIRRMAREKAGFFELYFIQRHQVEPSLSEERKARLNARRRRLEEVFRRFYREGVERGEVRPLRPKDASNLFFAQIMGMMLLHEYYGEEFDVTLDDHLEMSLKLYLEYVERVEAERPRQARGRASRASAAGG